MHQGICQVCLGHNAWLFVMSNKLFGKNSNKTTHSQVIKNKAHQADKKKKALKAVATHSELTKNKAHQADKKK